MRKEEGLRHWLRSSHQLLRGSQQRGYVHHRSPWCDHRFRGSKPQLLLAERSVFSGLVARQVASSGWSLSLLRTSQCDL